MKGGRVGCVVRVCREGVPGVKWHRGGEGREWREREHPRYQGVGCRVEGVGLRVYSRLFIVCRVCQVQGVGCRVQGVSRSVCRVCRATGWRGARRARARGPTSGAGSPTRSRSGLLTLSGIKSRRQRASNPSAREDNPGEVSLERLKLHPRFGP